jgi:ABC-2 type transport system ATP-binding protein
VALIGSNGAGKTTLIRCLLGEYTTTARCSIAGLDPRRERAPRAGLVGFVPQLPPPLKMPVGQLIDFAAALCGTPGAHRRHRRRLGLEIGAIRSRPFNRLSGGMKQKLLIAIALGRDARRAGHGRAGRQPRPAGAQASSSSCWPSVCERTPPC